MLVLHTGELNEISPARKSLYPRPLRPVPPLPSIPPWTRYEPSQVIISGGEALDMVFRQAGKNVACPLVTILGLFELHLREKTRSGSGPGSGSRSVSLDRIWPRPHFWPVKLNQALASKIGERGALESRRNMAQSISGGLIFDLVLQGWLA